MADFGNNSNNRRFSGRLEELLKRREERRATPSVAELRIQQQIEKDLARLEQMGQSISSVSSEQLTDKKVKELLDRTSMLGQRLDVLQKRQEQEAAVRMRAVEKTFQRGVQTALGEKSTTSAIAQQQRSTRTILGAIGEARTRPTLEIEESIQRKEALLRTQGERVRESLQNIDTEEGVSKFNIRAKVHDRLIRDIASERAQLNMQRRMGLDIESRYQRARKVAIRSEDTLGDKAIISEVIAGRAGSKSEIEKKLQSVSEDLVKTFKEFDEAVTSGADNMDELADKFEGLAKEQEKYEKTLRAMSQYGGGRFNRILGGLATAGTAATAAGQISYITDVQSEIRRENIRNTLGQISNAQYMDVFGATQGNMRALRRIRTAQYENEVRQGLSMAAESSEAVGMQAIGAGINVGVSTVGGGVKGALAGSRRGLVGAITGAVGGAVAGGANAAVPATALGVDYLKKLQANQDLAIRMEQMREQDRIRNMIRDRTTQAAFDFYRNIGLAGRGLGGQRAGITSTLQAPETIEELAGLGISPNELANLTGEARSTLGGAFNARNARSIMQQAGRLVQGGYMASYQDAIRAQGALSRVGGTEADLDEMLKIAVAQGMDSSKNLMDLVGLNEHIAAETAKMGRSTVEGTREILGRIGASLEERGVAVNMRSAASMGAIGTANQALTSTGLTFGNIKEFAALRRSFPDASLLELLTLQKLKAQDIEQLQGERGIEHAAGLGLESLFSRTPNAGQRIAQAAAIGAQENLLPQFISPRYAELSAKKRSGTLTQEETRELRNLEKQAASIQGASVEAFDVLNFGQRAQRRAPSTAVPITERIEAAAATGQATEVNTGIGYMGLEGGLQGIADQMTQIAQTLDPARFADNVDKSMNAFGVISDKFGKEFDSFSTAVDKFANTIKDLVRETRNKLAR